jgi:hypothetical protein
MAESSESSRRDIAGTSAIVCGLACAGRYQELAQRKVVATRAREITGANHRWRDGAPGDRHTEALDQGSVDGSHLATATAA